MENMLAGPAANGVPERVTHATMKLLAEQGPSAIKARGGIAELVRAVVEHGFKEFDRAFSRVPVTDDPRAPLLELKHAAPSR